MLNSIGILNLVCMILKSSVLLTLADETIGEGYDESCPYIVQSTFDACTTALSSAYHVIGSKKHHSTNMTCSTAAICNRTLRIAQFFYQTYADTVDHIVKDMLKRCCSNCLEVNNVKQLNDYSDIRQLFNVDLIYPVIAQESHTNMLFGYHFIPVLNVQSSYFFSMKKSRTYIVKQLISACLGMWPLLMICVLMALICGCVIWVLEKGKNTSEFSSSFRVGIFQGFWWSIVSMTTVGYGDITPKSIPGRLFGVIWIILGITILSIFTASLTSEVLSTQQKSKIQISGKTVGVLKNRLDDISIVAENGGIIKEIDYNKTVLGITEMFEKLENKEIDGFLFSKDTHNYFFKSIIMKEKYSAIREKVRNMNILKNELPLRDSSSSSGLLIKHSRDYHYFSKYIVNNRFQLQSCASVRSNSKDKLYEEYFGFTADNDVFFLFLTYSLGILGFFFLCGLIYEFKNNCNTLEGIESKKRLRDYGHDGYK